MQEYVLLKNIYLYLSFHNIFMKLPNRTYNYKRMKTENLTLENSNCMKIYDAASERIWPHYGMAGLSWVSSTESYSHYGPETRTSSLALSLSWFSCGMVRGQVTSCCLISEDDETPSSAWTSSRSMKGCRSCTSGGWPSTLRPACCWLFALVWGEKSFSPTNLLWDKVFFVDHFADNEN